jgi:hypothetical protein
MAYYMANWTCTDNFEDFLSSKKAYLNYVSKA